jgi:DNA-binding transcriptional MerR regulator
MTVAKMEDNKFTVPGTTIRIGGLVGSIFTGFGNMLSPFLGFGSGLLLSQITHIADSLTRETIQNWVKRNYVDPPRKGRFYDENQVARILIYNSLRSVLELDDIKLLLDCISGISHGTLAEKELLEIFNDSIIKTRGIKPGDLESYDKAVGEEIVKSLEKKEGDKSTVKDVIFIMLTAYQSSLLKKKADDLIFKLKANV